MIVVETDFNPKLALSRMNWHKLYTENEKKQNTKAPLAQGLYSEESGDLPLPCPWTPKQVLESHSSSHPQHAPENRRPTLDKNRGGFRAKQF